MDNKPILVAEEKAVPGDIYIDGPSPVLPYYHAVFEDDGTTGYLYAYDLRNEATNPILDAVHIYNVADVTDKNIPSLFQILWSHDGLKAALLVNGYPHAVFDLEARRGYCRTNFPRSHEWSDDCLQWF